MTDIEKMLHRHNRKLQRLNKTSGLAEEEYLPDYKCLALRKSVDNDPREIFLIYNPKASRDRFKTSL